MAVASAARRQLERCWCDGGNYTPFAVSPAHFMSGSPSGRLLRGIALTLLSDQVGVDRVDIGFAQKITETLHPSGGVSAVQDDVIEGSVQRGCQLAQVRRHVRGEEVAPSALL